MTADPTISAIDRFFDMVDSGVSKADRILNRSKYTDEQLQEVGRRGRKAKVIDTEAAEAEAPASKTPASKGSAIVRKVRFYIVESTKAGETIYVVTDGGKSRTECATRDFAEKILRSLEAQ